MLQSRKLSPSFDVCDCSLAIEFYSNILYNVSPYSAYSINQLIGHRGQAPPEVQRVAVNAMDLKKFLARYPTVFKVTENGCVTLEKIIAESSSDSDIAVQYYANILKKKCSGNTVLPIKNLIGYRSQGSPVVQNCARNENELYLFLCSHPDTFAILPGKVVTLRKSLLVTDAKTEPQKNGSGYDEYSSTLAVEYYSKILNATGPHYSLQSLIGHRGQAPPEVKKVAKTVSDLKLFLLKFPNTFSISGEYVTVKNIVSSLNYPKENAIVQTGIQQEKWKTQTGIQPGKFNVHTGIQPEKSNVPAGIHPVKFNVRTGIRPRNFNVPTVIQPEKYNVQTEIKPSKLNPEAAVQFYANILNEKGYFGIEYPIEKLSGYKSIAPLEVQKCAKNPNELNVLFSNYPNIFTVTPNRGVILIKSPLDSIVSKVQNISLTGGNSKSDKAIEYLLKPIEHRTESIVDKEGRRLRYFPSINFSKTPRFSGTWEDHVLDNIILVTEEYECIDACEIIKKEKVIALDCEGYNLGRGILSFIQIALVNGVVYIFDIYELPSMISCGLKEIIESDKILKVINYCRNDCLNLKGQYNVNLRYIFDVAVAYHVIECRMMSLSNFKPAGFNQICAKYGVPTNSYKDDLKFIYLTQPRYWLTRPITMKMISYAAFDVASLVPYLYIEFLKRMDQETEFAVWKLSQRMCIP